MEDSRRPTSPIQSGAFHQPPDHPFTNSILPPQRQPARLAAANSALISSQADAQALKQGGTQEERLNFASDLSKAQLQQSQAESNRTGTLPSE